LVGTNALQLTHWLAGKGLCPNSAPAK
jgi:hypothetical protein